MRTARLIFTVVLIAAISAEKIIACSICAGYGQSLSLREQALKSNSKVILFGVITKSSLEVDGTGKTEISVQKTFVLPSDFKPQASISIKQFLPFDANAYNGILLFADYSKGQLDVFRGVSIPSKEVSNYAAGALGAITLKGPALLDYYLPFLQSPSREIATDAFLEFAKASDSMLLEFSKKMNPALLKSWILDPKVPEERLGLYSFLLGGCGIEADITFLLEMLKSQDSRAQAAFDGAMVALIRLHPAQGWNALDGFLKADNTPLQTRLSCIRSIKVANEIMQGKSDKAEIFKALGIALKQGELADLAIEELRKMKHWGFTQEVLNIYGTKGYTAPVMKRAFLRYALTAPKDPQIEKFLAQLETKDSQMLLEVKESLGLVPLNP